MKYSEYIKYRDLLKEREMSAYCTYLPMDILTLGKDGKIHSIIDQQCEGLIKKTNLLILLNSIRRYPDEYKDALRKYYNTFINEMNNYYLIEQNRTVMGIYTPTFLQPVPFWQLKVFAYLERNISFEMCAIYLHDFSPCLSPQEHSMRIISIKNGHMDIVDEDGEIEYEPDNEDVTCFLIKLDVVSQIQF